jgi:guanyl-specific ribonuclease Sa
VVRAPNGWPRTGGSRFLEVDPVPGGSANDYDYCFQDPVNCRDLQGTDAESQTFLKWLSHQSYAVDEYLTAAAETIERAEANSCIFDEDGEEYGNTNGKLPPASENFYQSWTVASNGTSPGAFRGGARIVIGGSGSNMEIYLTNDHYESYLPLNTPAYRALASYDPAFGAGLTEESIEDTLIEGFWGLDP